MASLAPHRQLMRELIRSGRHRPRESRVAILSQMREIVSNKKLSATDVENVALFLRSQRTYKVLLDRYNPLHDMSSTEHIKATARRVGLDMPVEKTDSGSN
ncbi:hypothetical protein M408DRAFT_157342, partial [Serendipita vermifera MAFF 305830]